MAQNSNLVDYVFDWKINDFRLNMKSNEFSRWSTSKALGNTTWMMEINRFSNSPDDRSYISIYLHRSSKEPKLKFIVDFTITVVATDVSLNVSRRMTFRIFPASEFFGFDKFISITDILAERYSYLPRNTLTIQCDMIRRFDIGDLITCGNAETSNPKTLIRDLLQLRLDKKFCNIKICVEGVTIPVHKVLLCAQSPVFSTMFSNDTKENQSGVVNITDINLVTVRRMLKFMYSDEIEEMNQDEVANLYTAADKYQIFPLKEQCSTLLKTYLNEVNVYDIYTLADKHYDGNLKDAVKNYVFVYSRKILKSSEWNEFMQLNPQLSAEIMHKICIKYLDD